MPIRLAFCLLFSLSVAWADCTATGAVPPPPTRIQVDLVRELHQPWQAGGRIVVYRAPDGTPRAGRLPAPPEDRAEEAARRGEHLALAKRLNFARKGEAHPLGLPMSPPQIELLDPHAIISHEFGHTRYGDPASAGS